MIVVVIRWLFWRIIYLVRPIPRDLIAVLRRGERLRPPWWRFSPYLFHNHEGAMWQVYLKDEPSYPQPHQCLQVELHRSQDDGRIVGFNVFDENLAGRRLQDKETS